MSNSNNFLTLAENKKNELQVKEKWLQKEDKFLSSFEYLFSDLLIKEKLDFIKIIGIKSSDFSTKSIQIISDKILPFIDTHLKSSIEKIDFLNEHFNSLSTTANKKSFFSSKKNDIENFFNLIENEDTFIKKEIENLKYQQQNLKNYEKNFIKSFDNLITSYVLLERDIQLINKIQNTISKSSSIMIKNQFKEYEFEINELKGKLLLNQQIVLQKQASLKIIESNLKKTIFNIDKIYEITYHAFNSVVENYKIISLNKKNLSSSDYSMIEKMKEAIFNIKNGINSIVSNH